MQSGSSHAATKPRLVHQVARPSVMICYSSECISTALVFRGSMPGRLLCWLWIRCNASDVSHCIKGCKAWMHKFKFNSNSNIPKGNKMSQLMSQESSSVVVDGDVVARKDFW